MKQHMWFFIATLAMVGILIDLLTPVEPLAYRELCRVKQMGFMKAEYNERSNKIVVWCYQEDK